MRARLAADARARGAARRGRGGSSRVVQLQAELAQAKETALSMAKLLLAARETGQTVANALTNAGARDLHPKVCSSALPAEYAARVRDIANAIVPLEAAQFAEGVVAPPVP